MKTHCVKLSNMPTAVTSCLHLTCHSRLRLYIWWSCLPLECCIGAVHTNFKYELKVSSIYIHYHNYYVIKQVHLEQNRSARSDIFTFSQISTFCIFDIQICVSLDIMWLYETLRYHYFRMNHSALSKYAIKHTTIIFEKRLILAWWVTYKCPEPPHHRY